MFVKAFVGQGLIRLWASPASTEYLRRIPHLLSRVVTTPWAGRLVRESFSAYTLTSYLVAT